MPSNHPSTFNSQIKIVFHLRVIMYALRISALLILSATAHGFSFINMFKEYQQLQKTGGSQQAAEIARTVAEGHKAVGQRLAEKQGAAEQQGAAEDQRAAEEQRAAREQRLAEEQRAAEVAEASELQYT